MHDREKVIRDLEYLISFGGASQQSMVMQIAINALALLKEQETSNLYKCPNCGTWVSAENVVRCKDCKHGGCRTQNMDGSIFRVVCKKYSTKRNERWMDADWFCADGERKEGR